MAIQLKNPEANATSRQLYKLHKLTGRSIEELEGMQLNMQEASDRIEELDNPRANDSLNKAINKVVPEYKRPPFSEAHVTIIEGDQRSGKTNTAVGMIRDAYDNDCARVYCQEVFGIKCRVLTFNRRSRKGKVIYKGKKRILKIPKDYILHSPMRIFANIHLFGIPYKYCPSFGHILAWLKANIIKDGYLLIDEAYIGLNVRSCMTSFGKEIQKEGFQFAKSQLDVIIISHMPGMIDKTLRTTPTKHIICSYDKKTRRVTNEVKKKGEAGSIVMDYDATQYWGNFRTNEKVNA